MVGGSTGSNTVSSRNHAPPSSGKTLPDCIFLCHYLVHLDVDDMARQSHCIGNCFRVDVIVLVRLHVWLHILWQDQTHFMSLCTKHMTQKMRSFARFHANQSAAQVGCEMQELLARELLPHHNAALRAKSNHVEHGLPNIDAQGVSLHRMLPVYNSYTAKECCGPSHWLPTDRHSYKLCGHF